MTFLQHLPADKRPCPVPKASRTLGVGVLGLHEGRTLLRALDRCAHARAVAGCDSDPAKVASARLESPELWYCTDYAALLGRQDVDLVAIYTPDPLHGEHIARAFAAGKHVLCTKPLVASMEDAKLVLRAARSSDRRLFVGQSTRFFEPFLRQRAAFERGELGEIELLDAHYIHRMDWFYKKSPWAVRETDWVFLGLSHPVDLVRWYLGSIVEVSAYGSRSALAREYGLPGYDIYVVHLRTQNGQLARAMGHYGLEELPTARNAIELMLYGSGGTSQAQYHDMRYRYCRHDGVEITEDPLYALRHYYFNSEVHGMHYGEFANYTESFARALLEGHASSPELAEGLETFCVMEAIRRSAIERKPMALAPILAELGLGS